ncbi:MAG TPA: hypothetical protein VGH54_05605 [Mycobacterium sp.]|jgi:hypothetical protein|uniref:hypothetical protein n=1 Tax=Mycobacterium sp. TaxID=1785 RepID=UPI002F3ED0DD
MSDLIPNEAWDAAEAVTSRIDWNAHSLGESVLKAAAPHIARAAVIAELSRWVDDWGKTPLCCEMGGSEYYDLKTRLQDLRKKADELERGE